MQCNQILLHTNFQNWPPGNWPWSLSCSIGCLIIRWQKQGSDLPLTTSREFRNDKKLIEAEAKCCAVTTRGYLKDYHLWARATQRLLQSSQNIHPLSSGKDQGSKGIYRIWGLTMGLCNHLFKSIKHLDKICFAQHWGGVCSEPCNRYEMEIRPASVFQFTFLARISISTLKGVKRGNRIGDKTTIRGQSWMTELDEWDDNFRVLKWLKLLDLLM